MNTYEYTGITCVVDGKDMTKRATLDGKKLLVKDSYIGVAPLPDSDSEEDEEDAPPEEAVDAADKDTNGAGASAEPPPVPKRVRKPTSRMEAAPEVVPAASNGKARKKRA